MADCALEEGDVAMAAGLLVSFNDLLRPCEVMLNAGQRAVDLAQGARHVDLGLTKSGKLAGIAEHVAIEELEGVALLPRPLAGRARG